MDVKSFAFIIFLVALLLFGSLLVGSISGQVIRGDTDSLSGTEIGIILAVIFVLVQFIIALVINIKKSRKDVPIAQYLKEARKETY